MSGTLGVPGATLWLPRSRGSWIALSRESGQFCTNFIQTKRIPEKHNLWLFWQEQESFIGQDSLAIVTAPSVLYTHFLETNHTALTPSCSVSPPWSSCQGAIPPKRSKSSCSKEPCLCMFPVETWSASPWALRSERGDQKSGDDGWTCHQFSMFRFSSSIGGLPAPAPSALLSLGIKDLVPLVVAQLLPLCLPALLQILLPTESVSFSRPWLAFGKASSGCASASASLYRAVDSNIDTEECRSFGFSVPRWSMDCTCEVHPLFVPTLGKVPA